jgi:dihydropyrimidinase
MPRDSDYYTESAAAASGGVTTVINFDRAKEPYSKLFPQWLDLASDRYLIDFGYHLGILTESHLAELDGYVHDFGITSFKFYMNYRGSEKDVFDSDTALDDGFLFRILQRLVEIRPSLRLCVHCENMEITRALQAADGQDGGLRRWNRLRPGWAEAEAINRVLYLAHVTGASIYIVHVSAKESIEQLAKWDLGRMDCYVETCPHYLSVTVDSGKPLAKVNPPVRNSEDSEALWRATSTGMISTIGSDHVPRRLEMKSPGANFDSVKSGFPGVETLLPILLTEGYKGRGMDLARITNICSTNAARIFGIYPKKGTVQPGSDADLVFVDMHTKRPVSGKLLPGASGWSIYEDRELIGWPVRTMIRGQIVFENGHIMQSPGYGQYLAR